jgi:hypothetical protein
VFRSEVLGSARIDNIDDRGVGFARTRDGGVGLVSAKGSRAIHNPTQDYTNDELITRMVQQLCAEVGRIGEAGMGTRRIDGLNGALYLPATRTGFVQSLPILAENIVGSALSDVDGTPLPTLPAPTVQFLRLLVNPGLGTSWNSDLLADLEQSMLRGKVRSPRRS